MSDDQDRSSTDALELERRLMDVFLSGFQSGAVTAHMANLVGMGAARGPDDPEAAADVLRLVHHQMKQVLDDPAVRAEISNDVHLMFEGRTDEVPLRFLSAHRLEGGDQP